ncbi:hypothetical protein [Emcibacter sp. SYSU 3D8]|uniref:hypothetical protein n=1 Tax=Emcibacter sp. SYSU 3D8 TaxID=3133969 RepID=UPI0031FEA7ED
MATLYHLTARKNLRRILSEGFRNSATGHRSRSGNPGVRFSTWPLITQLDHSVAAVEIEVMLSEQELRDFEWTGRGDGRREFLIPADRVNDHCLLHVISEGEARTLADRASF